MAEILCEKTLATGASGSQERRTSERCSFIASAEVVDLNSNSRLVARTADINRRGCYIDTLNPLTLGAAVTLRLGKENRSFSANAEVVYVQTGNGMGLAFTAAAAEQLEILNQWIAGLNSTVAPNISRSELHQLPQPAAISHQSQQPTGKAANEREEPLSLMYLILMLVQKNILSEMEGKALLDKLPLNLPNLDREVV